mmetsp:Transcript_86563/g.258340  ORF Transcript_86563/g.258340 Transcript_86563/m.258340 type:complete len:239 (-) Transcript_86563:652-1368(-)
MIAFSSARSSTSTTYSLTAGSLACAIFRKSVEMAAQPSGGAPSRASVTAPKSWSRPSPERSSSGETPTPVRSFTRCISLRISRRSLESETSIGTFWRRFGGSCVRTSFLSRRTMIVVVRRWLSSAAFRAPTTLLTVLLPKICCGRCTQYRARKSSVLAVSQGRSPQSCGCSSSAEFRVGVPESRIARRALRSRGTRALVRAAPQSLMLWLSSAMTTAWGEPSGRCWNLPAFASAESRP